MAHVAHFSINADDLERARGFYDTVFGWGFQAYGPPGFYMIQGAGGPGGMFASLQQRREIVPGKPTFGLECTLSVDDSAAVEAAVLAAGGKIVMPRTILAGVGTLFFFEDTEGNIIGAMQYDPAVR
ncbi:MAG TPA: VOC family protein [Verrucomicrobiae bacterium]|nr:VOC family protein [Verrucomicrobiae bacterium]